MACLAKGIDRSRFDVSVCWLKENGVVGEELTRHGVEVLALPGRIQGQRDRLTSLKLRKLIRQRDIELIHTHDVHGFIDAVACRATMRGLRHVHTFHFGGYPRRQPRYRLLEQLLWRVPDALVAVGHAQADSIRSLYRIPANRMEVLWNGVDEPAADVSEVVREAVADAGVPVIGSISTLIEQKGLHHLLDAAARLKAHGAGFRLLLVGGGHLRESLEQQTRNLGLDRHVRFVGWVPEASSRALPACDIFVQSSLWEAMSIVVLEAMASGKPMVITRVGENPHVVGDENVGLTVPPADPEALAAALLRLLQDPELRSRLGQAARTRHAGQFTVRHMVDAHESLYARILNVGGAGA